MAPSAAQYLPSPRFRPSQHCSCVQLCCRGYSVILQRHVQGFRVVVGVQSAFFPRKHAMRALHAVGHGAHPESRQRRNLSTRTSATVRVRVLRVRVIKRILTLPNYGRKECQTCSYIKEEHDNQAVTGNLLPSCDVNAMQIRGGSRSRLMMTIPLFKTFVKMF